MDKIITTFETTITWYDIFDCQPRECKENEYVWVLIQDKCGLFGVVPHSIHPDHYKDIDRWAYLLSPLSKFGDEK